jgi:hypothetical protein
MFGCHAVQRFALPKVAAFGVSDFSARMALKPASREAQQATYFGRRHPKQC